MAKVSDARIALAALRAGFPVNEIPMAVAICLAESDGDPLAKGTNSKSSSAPGSHDLGLAQINDYYHSDLLAKYDWRDPDQNLKMAYLIWHESLVERASWGGTGWDPWSTYHNNSYAKYLKRGEAAARAPYRFTLTRYLMNHPHAVSKAQLDHGQDVLQLQRAIGMAHGNQDGYFGKQTEQFVQRFQRSHKLEVDGVVGKQTAKALGWTWLGR